MWNDSCLLSLSVFLKLLKVKNEKLDKVDDGNFYPTASLIFFLTRFWAFDVVILSLILKIIWWQDVYDFEREKLEIESIVFT